MAIEVQPQSVLYAMEKRNDKTNQYVDFGSIYVQHNPAIYRYILARVGYIDDAQDLTAQVFLNAYKNLTSYRQESSLIYWLIGIARHQITDYYRGKKTDFPFINVDEIASPAPPLEETIERQNRLKRISETLNALSEDRREALSMRLFAGLNNQEIAEIMDRSADAVAMLVHRGIQDLKIRLGEEEIS